ncbi:MAG: JAB domain-containing protein [Bacilli bacterium]
MKTNQLSDVMISTIKNEAESDMPLEDIKKLFEAYVNMQQKKYMVMTEAEVLYRRYEHLKYETNEVMVIAVANARHEIIHDEIVYRGKDNMIPLDIKDVLKVPLMNRGTYFAMIHNHPSGNAELSEDDVLATKNIVNAAKLVGLTLEDSITVAKNGFESVRTEYPEVWWNTGSVRSSMRENAEELEYQSEDTYFKLGEKMEKTSVISFINEVQDKGLDPLNFIDTYAEVVGFNGDESDLTFDNRQLQGSMQVEMIIDLVAINEQIIFEEKIFEAYGDIKQYLYNSDFYNINNNDNVINAFNEYFLSESIVKELSKVLTEKNSQTYSYNEKINTLVDEAYNKLKDISIFKNALLTPFTENDNFVLEVESKTPELEVSKILLEFDIAENMNPEYLAKQIVEEVQVQYELPLSVENELVSMIDDIDNKFQSDVEDALKPLQAIAEKQTGKNGLQFNGDDSFKDNYCNLELGTIDVKTYIDDILKSFTKTEMNHQSCVELLEVVYLYSEQVDMNVQYDLSSFAELHYYVLEDTMFELTSATTEYLNLNLDYNVDSFSDSYREIFNMYSDIVMTRLYEDYVENLDLSQVYYYDEDSINIWGDYKYINIENTVCLANVDWYNLVSYNEQCIEDIKSQLKWFEEEYDEDYSKHLNIINEYDEVIKNGGSMINTNNLAEELNEVFKELNVSFKVKNDEVLVYVNNQLEYTAGTIDSDTGIITQNYSSISILGNEDHLKEYTPNKFFIRFKEEGEKRILISKAEDHVTKALDEVFPDSVGYDISGAARFNLLCQFVYMSKDQVATDYLREIGADDDLSLGYKHMLNQDIDEVGEATAMYLKLTGNKLGVNESYKLNLHRVQQFFEYFPNINDDTKVKLMSIPRIEAAATVKDFENSLHEFKLIEVINFEKDMNLVAEDILALKDYLPIINDILSDGNSYKVTTAAKDILAGKELSEFEIKVSERFEFQVGQFGNEISAIEKINALVLPAFIKNDEPSVLFLNNLIDNHKSEFANLIQSNGEKLGQATIMYLYVKQFDLGIDNEFLIESSVVRKFFSEYENIFEKKEIIMALLASDKIKHNIMHKMSMSPGQKQLLSVANKFSGTSIQKDEICKLDKSNLKISKKLVELKNLKVSNEVKEIFDNLDNARRSKLSYDR